MKITVSCRVGTECSRMVNAAAFYSVSRQPGIKMGSTSTVEATESLLKRRHACTDAWMTIHLYRDINNLVSLTGKCKVYATYKSIQSSHWTFSKRFGSFSMPPQSHSHLRWASFESNRYNKITASHGLSKGMPRNSISCRGKVPSMTRRPSTWIIIQHWAPRPRHFLHTNRMQVRSKHSWRVLKWRTATAADLFTREIIDFSVPISSKFCFAFHAMNWLFNTYTPVVAPITPPKSFSLHYSCCWRTGLAMWQADGMALHQASLPSTPPELKKKEC